MVPMSEPFNAEAYAIVWSELTDEQRQHVKDKARWERISCAASLKWMYPDVWKDVLELSEAA